MSHRLLVRGSRACFRRPEIAYDHVTYDVITPMAARGIFEAIHWTPAIRWIIERIEILHPIRTVWSDFAGPNAATKTTLGRGLRESHLVDVAYRIDGRFEMTDRVGPMDSAAQHAGMFQRRARAGRFYRMPYLGRRDLVAEVHSIDDDVASGYYAGSGRTDFGWMLYDRNPRHTHQLSFYRPTLVDGVIDLTALTSADLVG